MTCLLRNITEHAPKIRVKHLGLGTIPYIYIYKSVLKGRWYLTTPIYTQYLYIFRVIIIVPDICQP